jgi:hypothetical protein
MKGQLESQCYRQGREMGFSSNQHHHHLSGHKWNSKVKHLGKEESSRDNQNHFITMLQFHPQMAMLVSSENQWNLHGCKEIWRIPGMTLEEEEEVMEG